MSATAMDHPVDEMGLRRIAAITQRRNEGEQKDVIRDMFNKRLANLIMECHY